MWLKAYAKVEIYIVVYSLHCLWTAAYKSNTVSVRELDGLQAVARNSHPVVHGNEFQACFGMQAAPECPVAVFASRNISWLGGEKLWASKMIALKISEVYYIIKYLMKNNFVALEGVSILTLLLWAECKWAQRIRYWQRTLKTLLIAVCAYKSIWINRNVSEDWLVVYTT